MVSTINWKDSKVSILDQTKLPHEVIYIDCTNYLTVVDCIKRLSIRGAPAIGIAAAMGVAIGCQDIHASNFEEFIKELQPVYKALVDSRPTAVNIQWAVNRMDAMLLKNRDKTILELKELTIKESQDILEEDIRINRQIGEWGAQFIKDGDIILTHCNAGSLATGGYGTATAPIRVAHEQGKIIHVIADETRPILQGARLTAWELMQDNIPVTLITDNTAGALMKKGEINLCIVGTDRTVKNGDVANKIGTYSVAVLASVHNIPFYVAAPISSIDFNLTHGDQIPIEERCPEEVTNISGICPIAPVDVMVKNIAFDVTPAKYITAIITEKGAFKPTDLHILSDKSIDFTKYRIM
ncbi:MAG: S-methyl-5-thioribose-1-phosphate isomerase [Nitrospirae bacterium]|nr:S-methyl-5-thioribose-1-phosphate isomerase [Nitrospirota bacterium]